jgi:malonyl-CoA O-methyltransferase
MDVTPSPTVGVREGYDRWSEIYDVDGNPLIALEEPLVRAWAGDPRGLRVADVGCGTGRHAAWLAAAGAEVDGFDDSPGMLDRARAKFGDLSVRLQAHQLPAPLPAGDGTYDLVIWALVADHVAQLGEVFADLRRVTRAGGRLLFTVMHPAMNLLGVAARFTDPVRGEQVTIASCRHTGSDYVMAALGAGWRIEDMAERAPDENTARVTARAEKYLGWPVLLAMKLRNTC